MKGLISEFKEFAVRGNVVDLAVAVVIGTVFGKVVSSLVDSVIMPTATVLLGGVDLSGLAIVTGKGTIAYGMFLQSIIDFLIIAWAVFFIVKGINALKRRNEAYPETAPTPPEDIQLLRDIKELLKERR